MVKLPLVWSAARNPDRFDTEGIDLLMPIKLTSISFALTLKPSLLDLNQPPGIFSADKGDLLSDQEISKSCSSPSALEALIHCWTFLESGRLRANKAISSTEILGDEKPNSLISSSPAGGLQRKVMGLKCSKGVDFGLSVSRHANVLVVIEIIPLSVS